MSEVRGEYAHIHFRMMPVSAVKDEQDDTGDVVARQREVQVVLARRVLRHGTIQRDGSLLLQAGIVRELRAMVDE